MIRHQALLVFVLAPTFLTASGDSATERARESLERVFPGRDQVRNIRAIVTTADRDELRRNGLDPLRTDFLDVSAVDSAGEIIGYGVMFDVPGKDQPITCLLIVGRTLVVREVQIVAYREPYGGEVRNPAWLSQFSGRAPGEPLRPGKEIRIITGATISSRSVTRGVQSVLAHLALLARASALQGGLR
jgi:hypothetical protein